MYFENIELRWPSGYGILVGGLKILHVSAGESPEVDLNVWLQFLGPCWWWSCVFFLNLYFLSFSHVCWTSYSDVWFQLTSGEVHSKKDFDALHKSHALNLSYMFIGFNLWCRCMWGIREICKFRWRPDHCNFGAGLQILHVGNLTSVLKHNSVSSDLNHVFLWPLYPGINWGILFPTLRKLRQIELVSKLTVWLNIQRLRTGKGRDTINPESSSMASAQVIEPRDVPLVSTMLKDPQHVSTPTCTITSKKDDHHQMRAVEFHGRRDMKVRRRPRPMLTDPVNTHPSLFHFKFLILWMLTMSGWLVISQRVITCTMLEEKAVGEGIHWHHLCASYISCILSKVLTHLELTRSKFFEARTTDIWIFF